MSRTPTKRTDSSGPSASRQRSIRIGTRRSPLALIQAQSIADALAHIHNWPANRLEIVPMATRGDKAMPTASTPGGGKALFTHELEEGLLDGRLDLAVHSLKDVPLDLLAGTSIGCVPVREDARDVLIIAPGQGTGPDDLPENALIGTASVRRAAQMRRLRPDIQIRPVRGNVETRLNKLEKGDITALVLAFAGLKRLNKTACITHIFALQEMLPAAAQGALGVQIRDDDSWLAEQLAPLQCADTTACVTAERAFLAALDGSCQTPIGVFARLIKGKLQIDGRLLSEDGRICVDSRQLGKRAEAAALGRQAAAHIRQQAPHLLPPVNTT